MNERQTRMPEHYDHTFEWVLKEAPRRGQNILIPYLLQTA
jgi:hypothetical protein